MSSQSSSSSLHVTKADLLYTISCLLADIDLVVERLDVNFHHSDVGKVSDMVDDLVAARDLLLDVDQDGLLETDLLVDDQCDEENSLSQNEEEDKEC